MITSKQPWRATSSAAEAFNDLLLDVGTTHSSVGIIEGDQQHAFHGNNGLRIIFVPGKQLLCTKMVFNQDCNPLVTLVPTFVSQKAVNPVTFLLGGALEGLSSWIKTASRSRFLASLRAAHVPLAPAAFTQATESQEANP